MEIPVVALAEQINNEQGFVTLPNGDKVNGLGVATRNTDGGDNIYSNRRRWE